MTPEEKDFENGLQARNKQEEKDKVQFLFDVRQFAAATLNEKYEADISILERKISEGNIDSAHAFARDLYNRVRADNA